MRKKYKKRLIIISVIIIALLSLFIGIKYLKKEDKEHQKVNVIDSLDQFNYNLEDRDTELFKENYELLKEVLKKDSIDDLEYAKYLAKLFIIDLFTINNKISKYDVGGIEYIHPDYVDGYKLNVEQTLYLTLENNVDGKRIQELPEVKSVNVIEVKEDKYILNEEEKDAIVVNLEWTYIEDYGYDTSANVTCLKIDDKMYIAQYAITE